MRPVKSSRAARPDKERDDVSIAINVVRALFAAFSQSARRVERTTGLTNAQLFLLRLVDSEGTVSIGSLAAIARTQQATVSIVVRRLVLAGYLTKVRASDDARRAVIRLTPSGRKLLRRAPTPPTARLLDATSALSTRDVAALASGLTALAAALELDTSAPALLFEDLR